MKVTFKNRKRISALLLSLVLALGASLSAFADDGTAESNTDSAENDAALGFASGDSAEKGYETEEELFDLLLGEDRSVVVSPENDTALSLQDVYSNRIEAPAGWSAFSYGGKVSFEASDRFDFAPCVPFAGEKALAVSCDGYTDGTELRLVYTPSVKIDLSGARWFCFALATEEKDGVTEDKSSYTVNLTLTADRDRYISGKTVRSGRWNMLFFDLSLAKDLSDVRQIEIGVVRTISGTADEAAKGDFSYAIDCMGGCSSANALFSMYYMADNFRVSVGSELNYTDSSLLLSAKGENPFITSTDETLSIGLGSDKAIRVRFAGQSCRTVTLYYTTLTSPDMTASAGITSEVVSDGIVSTCIFRVPDNVITGIRLRFGGTFDGDIMLLSVDTVSYPSAMASTGRISECSLLSDGQSISIKGSVFSGYAEDYKNCTLYLYMLEPFEDASDITIRSVASAETQLDGSTFSFTLPCAGNNELIFRKYLVAVYYEGSLVPITTPRYISNPGLLSQNTESLPSIGGIKGSTIKQGDFPDKGEKYSAVQVRLEKLVTTSFAETIHFYGGRSFYFNSSYISTLDRQLKDLAAYGTQVYLSLTVSKSNNESLDRYLIHPQADLDSGAEYFALNTETADGILYLRAACDFLSSRYCAGGELPSVCGFVIGQRTENAYSNYNCGDLSLGELAKSLSTAMHTVRSTVTLRSPGTGVYLSVGCNWNDRITSAQIGNFDSSSLLYAVSSAISDEGDFGYGIAYDPYPDDPDRLAFNEDRSSIIDRSFEAESVTLSNIEVLVSFMSDKAFRYDGEPRSLILLERFDSARSKAESDKTVLYSAEYVFAFSKLCSGDFGAVSSFIVSHNVSYLDTYALIDTTAFSGIAQYALEILELDTLPGGILRRDVTEKPILFFSPFEEKGKATLFGFSESTDGFEGLLNCSVLSNGGSVSDKNAILSAQFEEVLSGEYMSITRRITSPLELSGINMISFELQPTSLPSSVRDVTLTVILRFAEDSVVYSGSIKAGVWTKVFLDISESKLMSLDRIDLMISSKEASLGEPSLLVDTISVLSSEKDSEELEYLVKEMKEAKNDAENSKRPINPDTVRLLVLLIICALSLEILNLLLRRSSKEN